eukprot:8427560-Prorocentrum_lima.AAC.1
MTSSLVGSEMCIRDSRDAWCATCVEPISSGSLRVQLAGTQGARCPASVSYTHLTLPTICSV